MAAPSKSSAAVPALPDLEDGEMAVIEAIEVKEKKTKPPLLYTEGTLLEDMKAAAKFVEDDPKLKAHLKDVLGIGTPATRPAILEGLKSDKYCERKGKNIIASEKGEKFIAWIQQAMPEIADVALTARWEAELSVIAKKGGGAAFEQSVADSVKTLVATLKTAPRMTYGAPSQTLSKENSNMSENRSSKPTDKMLDFAKSIAKSIGTRVPDEVLNDFDACKAFIDANKEAASRPSEKQENFAKSIAERKGLTIPEETLKSRKDLSAWIDAHL